MLQYVDAVFAFASALGNPDVSLSDRAVWTAIVEVARDPAPPPSFVDQSGLGACSSWATRVGHPAAACDVMSAGAKKGSEHAFQCVNATYGQDALTGRDCAAAAEETTDAELRRWYRAAALACDCVDGDGTYCR